MTMTMSLLAPFGSGCGQMALLQRLLSLDDGHRFLGKPFLRNLCSA